jgi:hypothetical protein
MQKEQYRLTTLNPPAIDAGPSPPRPPRRASPLLAGTQTLAIALMLILIAGILHVGESAYLSFAFTGAFATLLMFQPSLSQLDRPELTWAIVAGAGFGGVYALMNHGLLHPAAYGAFYGGWFAIPGAFLGMGTLFTLGTRWIWANTAERRMRFERVRDAALVPLLCVATMVAVGPAIGMSPLTYDGLLYIVDTKFIAAKLAAPPSWVVGRLFLDHSWMRAACGYVYNSLPLGVAICLAFQWQDRQRKLWYPVDMRWLSVALGVAGLLLYQICPAAGPIYLFPKQFPSMVPNLDWVVAAPAWLRDVPRNGMPSLHVAWTMLLFWNVRHRAWWIAAAAAIYLTMTAVATLGLGEHYLVDLMVAVPVGLSIQALWLRTRSTFRLVAIGAGAAITLGWLIAFRTGAALAIPAGPAMWAVSALTVLVPVAMAWRMER